MRYVLITVDYEIFGNGTGDVRQHVVDPTERMARMCSEHEVPLTVYFETEEYLAFERHRVELKRDLGYDPAAAMREQAVSLVRAGHDLQLHLHPQWVGSEYANGTWNLRPEKQTVDSLFESQQETTSYLGERQSVLEDMAGEAIPGRKIRAYRAGAFSAQPGKKLLAGLAQCGFRIDSSVVHGLHRSNAHVNLDYRQAPPGRRMWCVRDDVAMENAAGRLWEMPITSNPGRRFHQATFGRLKAKFSRNVPKARQGQMIQELGIGRNPFKWARFLWQQVPIKFDFHNVAPYKLVRWICNLPPPKNGDLDVVVLIGHTKEHIDDHAFNRFLDGACARSELRIVSFDHVAGLLEPAKSVAAMA